MKENINPIIAVLAAALGVASSYLVQLIVPLIVLVIAMLRTTARAWPRRGTPGRCAPGQASAAS